MSLFLLSIRPSAATLHRLMACPSAREFENTMNRATIILVTLLGLSLVAGPSSAEARQKAVAIKKHKIFLSHAKRRTSMAAWQEAASLVVQSASALVMDQST